MNPSFAPVARAQMLIRRPVAEVFEAFADPDVTTRFWFSRSSGRLADDSVVKWHWDMYGVSVDVAVKRIEPPRRILIHWPTPVEWLFEPRGDAATLVVVTASGFTGSDDEKATAAIDAMGGFSLMLAACKAWLEHGLQLNLVADHDPDAQVPPGTA
jgi:uncharacterized protein YndB with AHSA1/START domain